MTDKQDPHADLMALADDYAREREAYTTNQPFGYAHERQALEAYARSVTDRLTQAEQEIVALTLSVSNRDAHIAELTELQQPLIDTIESLREQLAAVGAGGVGQWIGVDERLPVMVWCYQTNNTHTLFSFMKPPEDAYDVGTLIPLVRLSDAQAALAAKDVEISALIKANGLLKTYAETSWARGRAMGVASNVDIAKDADKARRAEHADRLSDNARLTEALTLSEDNLAAKDAEIAGLREAGHAAQLSPAAVGPVVDSYVQPVPDHCDRITWRNQYYHLPLKGPEQPLPQERKPLTSEQRRKMLDRAGAHCEGLDGETWDQMVIDAVEAHHRIVGITAQQGGE